MISAFILLCALGFPAQAAPSATMADSIPHEATKIKPEFTGGLQMGYSLGQNGQGWPQPWKNPLNNNSRGGFYMNQTRVGIALPLDSSFKAVGQFNVIYLDLQDAYLEKTWGRWVLTAGKFRGAGLHSGVAWDEFEQAAVLAPFYARVWNGEKRLFNFRDFGVQMATRHFGGRFEHRLFAHNGHWQNYRGDEPSNFQGPPTQVLAFDYAWDVNLPDSNRIGGHIGALADREWDEFVGAHDFWEAGYWFKTNPIVDGSFYHALQGETWHWTSEMLIRLNRRNRNALDSSASQSWGMSTQFEKKHSARFGSVWRYEFFDPSDGLVPNDNLHLVTAGLKFKPSPLKQPGVGFVAQYVRVLEQDLKNIAGNDILYLQTQITF